MKQTPFYEIGVALKGRPRIFRIVVIAGLHLSFLVMLYGVSEKWQEVRQVDSVLLEKRAGEQL
ncbi:MAG TPA: hypothetical protein VMR70_04980, partial [Flavisolibacter sp.]|nr:hypothetical protein [Flavisolibacter sp.]